MSTARTIFSAGRHTLARAGHADFARRQAVIARLQSEHPEWSGEQILFAALAEMHGEMDAEFARQAAAHIAEWSAAQGVRVAQTR